MGKIFLYLMTLFSCPVFAESGFNQLEKLFQEGHSLDLKIIKGIDQGIYIGRCFNSNDFKPYGAAAAFKNLAQDSGPIIIDPDLHIGFQWSQQSNYFDQIIVKDFVETLPMSRAEKNADSISYEVLQQNWQLHFRMNGDYVVQKNIVSGMEDSYCYFYAFRQK